MNKRIVLIAMLFSFLPVRMINWSRKRKKNTTLLDGGNAYEFSPGDGSDQTET